jgi:hypothetical protein
MPSKRNTSDRCIGINKRNGQQCKRKTGRGPLCYAHLEIEKHLKIKKSTIPRAGHGLFVLKEFKKKQIITPYGGKSVTTNNPNFGGDYVLQLSRNKFLDGDPKVTNTSIGAFCNNCKTSDRVAGKCGGNNANFAHHSANVKATKKIKKGEEILASYGRTYWTSNRRRKL